MARKIGTHSPAVQTPSTAPTAQAPQAESYAQIKQDLLAAMAPGPGRSSWLSQDEIRSLIDRAEAAGPEVCAQLKSELAQGLKAGKIGDLPLVMGETALQEAATFAGVPAGTYRAVVQAKDGQAEHELANGLAKEKQAVTENEITETRKRIAFAEKSGRAITKKELTPHYQAAKLVAGELKTALDEHMAENHPEAKVAMDAVSPHVARMVRQTVEQLDKDPEAMARVCTAIARVGQAGFSKAVDEAAPDLAEAFTKATGVQFMNAEVVGGLLDSLPKLAAKVSPDTGAKLAQSCASIGAKLGVETAEQVAKKAAEKGATKAAEKVAEKGAEAAATSGSKAVPGLGNVVAVSSLLLAGVRLVKTLFSKQSSGEQKAKEGVNTLMQAVGVAFPWVGLAGDVVDVGWTAKMAASEGKKDQGGEPGAGPGVTKEEAAPLVAEPARLLASVLEGAGNKDAAGAFRDLADTTESLAGAKALERSQLNAVSTLSNVASSETGKAAASEDEPLTRDALDTVAHGFGELFSVLYRHNKLKGQDGPKRDELQADLLRITGDVALAAATLATAKAAQQEPQ